MVDEVAQEAKCAHHWIIDNNDIGVCKYCKGVKDFSKLQGEESRLLGLKSVSNKAEAKAKWSTAAKKRWQNPEYRAKQIATMKGRRHKKEPLF
ncbi:hypothetical protein ES704_01981 [subsurface metagenome]|jgi:hypothetical protein